MQSSVIDALAYQSGVDGQLLVGINQQKNVPNVGLEKRRRYCKTTEWHFPKSWEHHSESDNLSHTHNYTWLPSGHN